MNTKLERMGITSDNLDEIVIEAAERMASNANNGGVSDQLSFLHQSGYSDEDIMGAVLQDRLKPGSIVEVTDPQAEDATHAHAFSGFVVETDDAYVRVVDQDGETFDVSYVEIADFQ